MNHYGCLIDITSEPYFCSEHEVYLADDGTELVIDEDTVDYSGINTGQEEAEEPVRILE